jgi:chromate transporter
LSQSDATSFDAQPKPTLAALSSFFLTLGALTFGGPAAHIAVMQENLVERRRWITSADFLDMLAVSNLIPGPSSTELAIFIGYRLRGFLGLLTAGICFILPAALIVWGFAWAYMRFGHLPAVAGAMQGVKPVVIAIIVQAIWKLSPAAFKTRKLVALAVVALAACLLGVSPIGIYAICGAFAFIFYQLPTFQFRFPTVALLLPTTMDNSGSVSNGSLFLIFLKIGSTLFGSGYVLLAMLRNDLVIHRHWLTDAQVLDAVAIGQVTPGPVFTTATFIGYLLSGTPGACAATIGIFAPAFLLIWIVAPLAMRIRHAPTAGAIMDGLNVAAVTLMAFAAYSFALDSLTRPMPIVIAMVSAVVLLRFRINPTWLLGIGAAIGIIAALR